MPTPIQEQAIPHALQGHDIMGLAQTGTGKTAAFGLPLVQQLLENGEKPKPKSVRALILAPTRELVNQISENLRQYVKKTPVWVNVVIGGANINSQRRTLANGSDIVVATPGRLLDLVKRDAIHLNTVKFLVLDEADQMLDLGFIHSLREIASLLAKPRQTMLFSATMPKQVENLAQTYLEDPIRVEVAPPGKAADKITQCVHHVPARNKANLLRDLLTSHENALSLVFARTKHGAEKLKNHLVDHGFHADSIHGNKSQGQRDRAIRSFKKREIEILVATDVAARGIDIPGVTHVYNFNLPEVAEAYVHRIGRTARAGERGEAIAFCAPDEFHLLKQIERLMSISIPVTSGDEPDSSTLKNKKSPARNTRGRAGNKPQRGRQRYEADVLEPSNTQDNPKKKFKNKQISVTDFDAQEQRRKDNRENRKNDSTRGRNNRKPMRDGEKPAKTWEERNENQRNSRSEENSGSSYDRKPSRNRQRGQGQQSGNERFGKARKGNFSKGYEEKSETTRNNGETSKSNNRNRRNDNAKVNHTNKRNDDRFENQSGKPRAKFGKNKSANSGRNFSKRPSQNRSKRRESA